MSKPDPISKPMLLEVDKLNGLLVDLYPIRNNKPVFESERNTNGYWYEIYDMGLGAGAFVKLHIEDDGDGREDITGIQFVAGTPKTITVYDF